MSRAISVLRLGQLRYGSALALQERLVEARKRQKHAALDALSPNRSEHSTNTLVTSNKSVWKDPLWMSMPDLLLLLEHPPTFTAGRRVRNSAEEAVYLRSLGAEYFETARGGEMTFHGPGQLIGYPIIDLHRFVPNVHTFVHGIESMLIQTCSKLDVGSSTTSDTGVWVGNDKIAAVGIQVSFGISSHGFALNCNTDLSWFKNIVPCGLIDKGVTSLTKETGKEITTERVTPNVLTEFAKQFKVNIVELSSAHEALIRSFVSKYEQTSQDSSDVVMLDSSSSHTAYPSDHTTAGGDGSTLEPKPQNEQTQTETLFNPDKDYFQTTTDTTGFWGGGWGGGGDGGDGGGGDGGD